MGGRRLALLAVLLAAAAGGLSLAMLGGGSGAEAEQVRFLPGNSRAGAGGALSQVPEAECSQWRRASAEQRRYVVQQLGALFDRREGGARLPSDYAHDVLGRACSQRYASAFKLWKVYERALAFQYERP